MLKELRIQNIILIESATLSFDEGLHIFSGETGAGKTAILKALELTFGKRSETQIIRKGCDKALVEALFELKDKKRVYSLLAESGIEIEFEEDLLIKREVSILGKNRIFINNQMAQLSLLKQIAPYLLEIVSQHATQKLFDLSTHREMLDRFGGCYDLANDVKEAYFQKQSLENELKKLEEKEERENTLKKEWQESFDEIDSAQIQSHDEEELLFQEYETLSHTKELYDTLSKTYFTLQEQEPSILTTLKTLSNELYKINVSSDEFKNIQEELRSLSENLSEFSFSTLKYRDSLEENPERLFEIDERLKLFRTLTKKYGPSLQEVIEKKDLFLSKINSFEEISDQKEKLHHKINTKTKELKNLASTLSNKREHAKNRLEEKLSFLFNELNLKGAKLFIHLEKKELYEYGQESIEFFLRANKGEKETSLKEGVSGGELSRVLLALKVILSELEEIPSLIFDEIDANLGGETAPKIGKLLKEISQKKQVFAITHLPQVALFASHHYQIHKKEEGGRTFSLIEKLSEKQKVKEIERMLGGSSLAKSLLESAVKD